MYKLFWEHFFFGLDLRWNHVKKVQLLVFFLLYYLVFFWKKSSSPNLVFGDMVSGTGGSEHISFLSGVRIIRSDRQAYKYSGYQVMRLATELVPAVSAIITPRLFSPFWVVIFYFTMIVFGLAQQMALFHTVSSGLIAIKSDYFLQFESSLIFISCLLGLIFCFPLATEVNTKLWKIY